MPAVPARVMADADESFTMIFDAPFTEATSRTGLVPVADSEIVAQFERSAIPLAACASTVTDAPLCRRICNVPFARRATS